MENFLLTLISGVILIALIVAFPGFFSFVFTIIILLVAVVLGVRPFR